MGSPWNNSVPVQDCGATKRHLQCLIGRSSHGDLTAIKFIASIVRIFTSTFWYWLLIIIIIDYWPIYNHILRLIGALEVKLNALSGNCDRPYLYGHGLKRKLEIQKYFGFFPIMPNFFWFFLRFLDINDLTFNRFPIFQNMQVGIYIDLFPT